MAVNRGKQFEAKFAEDWKLTFPNSFCLRLPDQQSRYFGTSRNISDYICYNYPNLYLLECKTHYGNTFPFSEFRQYEKLLDFKNLYGGVVGLILWFIDHDKVLYIPIDSIEKMKLANKKSVNIKMLAEKEFVIYDLPSIKKRVFMNTDYSMLSLIGDVK